MATVADLEVKQLENHLVAGGFSGPFTGINSGSQPAPVLQPFEMDLTRLSANDRAVMIRNSGSIVSSTRVFFKERPMLIAVIGKQGVGDRIVVNGLADDMEAYLVGNPTDDGCITNITSSGVTGPFITDDGRRVFEISLVVRFNINLPEFV